MRECFPFSSLLTAKHCLFGKAARYDVFFSQISDLLLIVLLAVSSPTCQEE